MIASLRMLLRWLQLRSARPWLISRLGLAILSTPLLLAVLISIRLRAALRGVWQASAETDFGARMNCLLPDVVQAYVYLFGVWEPDITDYVRRTLQPKDTFVDVGAHAGYYTLLASQLVGSQGRVVSIEASPSICELLRENLSLNPEFAARSRVVNAAASFESGELTIHRGPAWNLGWSTTLASRGLVAEAVVRAAPLDDLLTAEEAAAARLIKIDVEGNERDVIAGMSRLIAACRPDAEFLLELSPLWWVTGSKSPETALASFLAAGFVAYRLDNDYLPWRYLWPHFVRRPRRVSSSIRSWIGQVDLVLSRRLQAEL